MQKVGIYSGNYQKTLNHGGVIASAEKTFINMLRRFNPPIYLQYSRVVGEKIAEVSVKRSQNKQN